MGIKVLSKQSARINIFDQSAVIKYGYNRIDILHVFSLLCEEFLEDLTTTISL